MEGDANLEQRHPPTAGPGGDTSSTRWFCHSRALGARGMVVRSVGRAWMCRSHPNGPDGLFCGAQPL